MVVFALAGESAWQTFSACRVDVSAAAVRGAGKDKPRPYGTTTTDGRSTSTSSTSTPPVDSVRACSKRRNPPRPFCLDSPILSAQCGRMIETVNGRLRVLVAAGLAAGGYWACCWAGESAADRGESEPAHATDTVSVQASCEAFARAYAKRTSAELAEGSVETALASRLAQWLSNAFQPDGSRFVSGYRCRFRTMDRGGDGRAFSVGLYLAQTRAFAEHTLWKDTQIVPVEPVVDADRDMSGYGVFKYLREE